MLARKNFQSWRWSVSLSSPLSLSARQTGRSVPVVLEGPAMK